MGVGRNAPATEVRKKKVRGFLSIPDSGRSVSFSWWDAFQVLAELLPILWLHFPAFRAICLYSFHSEVRKENYFHISNSLNGPKLVAQSLLEPNPLFLHFQIPTWRHCLESRGLACKDLLSCTWASGWGGALSPSSIILHQCHHHLQRHYPQSLTHSIIYFCPSTWAEGEDMSSQYQSWWVPKGRLRQSRYWRASSD